MLTNGQIMNVLGIFLEMVSIYLFARGVPKSRFDHLMKRSAYIKPFEKVKKESYITVITLVIGGLLQIIATLIP